MKKIILLIVILLNFIIVSPVFAIYDPKSTPNNKFGIHILFPSEIPKAAELINSSGGDWGYVTIPIKYSDRDLEKWQQFMKEAKKYHVVPILRIATDAYHANTGVWRKPNDFDVVDFVNFLNSLNWPTKNRYVMFYNEINRNDEWGGLPPSPEEYADSLSYAINVFKSQSQDFFIIAAGLDNASPNDGIKYMDNFVFLRRMGTHNPEVFKKIDGFSSHSYPNPNFAQPPSKTKLEGTATYKYEGEIINGFAGSKKPIFITETGWNADALPASVIASYYKIAMNEIWGADPDVVAVTPFVLESNGGPFDKFTFFKAGQFTEYGKAYKEMTKVKGAPVLDHSADILSVSSLKNAEVGNILEFVPLVVGDGAFAGLTKWYFKSLFSVGK
jgi:hypothetical protein